MVFRKAKKNDCKKLDDMLTKLIIDERNYDPDCEMMFVIDYYINFVDDKTKYLYLAEEEGNIVGYIYVKMEDNKALIDALYVDENYRNKGIASRLIEDAISYVKKRKISIVTIKLLSNNIKAKNLYLKYFKPYKEELKLEVK